MAVLGQQKPEIEVGGCGPCWGHGQGSHPRPQWSRARAAELSCPHRGLRAQSLCPPTTGSLLCRRGSWTTVVSTLQQSQSPADTQDTEPSSHWEDPKQRPRPGKGSLPFWELRLSGPPKPSAQLPRSSAAPFHPAWGTLPHGRCGCSTVRRPRRPCLGLAPGGG